MRWLYVFLAAVTVFFGPMIAQSQAQWAYSRYSGNALPNPAYGGFNLGSPVAPNYPTNNYTNGFYTMNSIVSPTNTGYFGAAQNSYSYPIPSTAGYAPALLGSMAALSRAASSPGISPYGYAPAVGLDAGPRYGLGGYLGRPGGNASSAFGYPYGSATTGSFRSMGSFSSTAGTYLGPRFAYP
jgi:hypothetical protein